MAEKMEFPKLVTRVGDEIEVKGMEGKAKIRIVDDWAPVEGGVGVRCRTWAVDGLDFKADGADILMTPEMEIGRAWTPVQLVKATEVVVDIPEDRNVVCVVRNKGGEVYSVDFSKKTDEEMSQMVWEEGSVICWITTGENMVRITEMESPPFLEGMFENIAEGAQEFEGMDLREYWEVVRRWRGVGVE